MRLSQICIAIAQLGRGGAWSPLALWPDGIDSPGMWISPRTLTSEWQEYNGLTPVVTPGTVADSANPVGLALDIRAGAPEVLGPEMCAGAPGYMDANWTDNGNGTYTGDGGNGYVIFGGGTANRLYQVSITIISVSQGNVLGNISAPWDPVAGTVKTYTSLLVASGSAFNFFGSSFIGTCSFSVKEVPGNHMLQSTSAARPLMSAYDGQTLGPGDTYSSTGYPIFQKYDGVDDGMATAAFSAGTLIDGTDCMIAVRRDAGTIAVAGLNNQAANVFFGIYVQGDAVVPTHQGCGAPVPYVDGVELTGGTSATRGTLYTALTAGEWHILEYRNLDLSAWTQAFWGAFGASFFFNGARGDILLYPSTASTADKDAARQWLADYYGVTLP